MLAIYVLPILLALFGFVFAFLARPLWGLCVYCALLFCYPQTVKIAFPAIGVVEVKEFLLMSRNARERVRMCGRHHCQAFRPGRRFCFIYMVEENPAKAFSIKDKKTNTYFFIPTSVCLATKTRRHEDTKKRLCVFVALILTLADPRFFYPRQNQPRGGQS